MSGSKYFKTFQTKKKWIKVALINKWVEIGLYTHSEFHSNLKLPWCYSVVTESSVWMVSEESCGWKDSCLKYSKTWLFFYISETNETEMYLKETLLSGSKQILSFKRAVKEYTRYLIYFQHGFLKFLLMTFLWKSWG